MKHLSCNALPMSFLCGTSTEAELLDFVLGTKPALMQLADKCAKLHEPALIEVGRTDNTRLTTIVGDASSLKDLWLKGRTGVSAQ